MFKRYGDRTWQAELTFLPPVLLWCSLVRQMMYGFGDEMDGPDESVAVMEDLLAHFIQELVSVLSCSRR